MCRCSVSRCSRGFILTSNRTGVVRVRSHTASRFLNRPPRPSHPITSTLPNTSPTRARPQLTPLPSSVSVTPECITAFNELKLGKSLKWIIFKISDDWKEIVVEEKSSEANYDAFREKLISAKSKDRKGNEGIGGRYAVYDVEYDAPGGEGKRSKITFISWVPDDATQYVSAPPRKHKRLLNRHTTLRTNITRTAPHDVLLFQGRPQARPQRPRRRHPGQRRR